MKDKMCACSCKIEHLFLSLKQTDDAISYLIKDFNQAIKPYSQITRLPVQTSRICQIATWIFLSVLVNYQKQSG